MKFNEALKRYKRFMKERGLYSRMLALHTTYDSIYGFHKKERKKYTFKELLTSTLDSPCKWIQNSTVFCTWSRTKEGDGFWWIISILWEIKCFNEKIYLENRPCCSKKEIISEFDSLKSYIGKNKSPLYKELEEKIENLKKE
jgi:hypothetical protein